MTDKTLKILVCVAPAMSLVAILFASASFLKQREAESLWKKFAVGDDQPVIMAGGSLHMLAPNTAFPSWSGPGDVYTYSAAPGKSVQSVDFSCADSAVTSYQFAKQKSSITITYGKNNKINTALYEINDAGQVTLTMTDENNKNVKPSIMRSFVFLGFHPKSQWDVSLIRVAGFKTNPSDCNYPTDNEFFMQLHVCTDATCK